MKKTPLSAVHEKMGARMVEFAGFAMPVQYTGIIEEHTAVRTKAGLFDLYHMGEFWLTGPDALKNVQKIITQDAEALSDRQIAYTPMCRPDGTIVDDLLVYRWNPEKFLLVVNAANIQKDFDWIKSQLSGNYEFEDHSERTGLIALQGPKAQEILQKLTRQNLKAVKFYWFTTGKVNGVDMIISRTGYTGEDGFELYFPAEKSEMMWHALLEAGQGHGLVPVGLGARDTLRLEARLMLYGNDIHDQTTPIEANLDWTVKFGKGPFNGSEVLKKQKESGTTKTLVGFEMGKGPAPRHGYAIYSQGQKVGEVTSGTMSPTLQKNIGLGYVPPSLKAIGSTFEVEIRGKMYPATVIPTPFYSRSKDK
ncbi:MAG: Aminomethyltransferase (glycine cleavage system T protein) [Candidatus Ozemobacter sibiricus]|jgi:aminomethyltransferase|uniref:Aminomethyltransferase n=1 Tax=Candidatus Ozemobacter sibiricus TaxID=2268124 RepID=A0A367ZLE7_9BACT|nr:MAG: Aminomethyltransferase (glycine cleavage system T protein) [Candidatus Ozemobacter sibiricus]